MEPIPESAWQVITGGGTVALVGLFARFFIRMVNKDKVSFASERSEITQIARLELEVKRQTDRADREAARADLAYKERNDAIEKGAKAIGEVAALRLEVESMKLRIMSLESLLQGFYGVKKI